jgi:hypothetical protein
MVSSTSLSLREILESRLTKTLLEMESALDSHVSERVAEELERRTAHIRAEVREHSQRELADHLNMAVRRMRQAQGGAELGAALLEGAAPFATGIAFFRLNNGTAFGEGVRGTTEECAATFRKREIPLNGAAALAEAVQSRDPVTAAATAGEVSEELAGLAATGNSARVFVYPILAGDRVPALLCAWGEVLGSAMELLAQVAGAALSNLPDRGELLSIAPAAHNGAKVEPSAWDALSSEDQQLHLRAQRSARVQVAEIRLFELEAVRAGRARHDLYGALRARIDAARETFQKTFFTATPTMVDYLHLELVRTLANDEPELLGKEYPGPIT